MRGVPSYSGTSVHAMLDTVQRRTPSGDHVPEDTVITALRYAAPADATTIAVTAWNQGRYPLAEIAIRQAHTARQGECGPDHPDTLTSRSILASVLQGLGRLGEAEAESRAVRETSERVLGAGHLDTLASRRNLDALIDYRGRSR
jgi:eukaryotic-like serine/threonine-protein kinase